MTLCANNTPSTNEYTGNGAITEYSITFQYYSQSDIFVAFYDTATEAWVSVSNSNWSFLNPTVIKFNTAPADNQRILIYRCTDIDPLPAEFFPGTSIKAADLNNNFFVMKSAIEEINTQAGTSDTLAQSAKATADIANTKADTAIATANTASTNASSAVTTANSADTNATTALNAANSATSTANTALSTANTANTTANTANTTANTANTAATAASSDASAAVSSANAAVTTANTADTNATTALNTANSVAGVANTANTNATTALNTANTALSTANTANTTANNALSQVSAAAPWTESSGTVGLNNIGSKVGIGDTSVSLRKLTVNDATDNTYIAVRSNNTGKSGILFGDQSKDFDGQIVYHNPDNALAFHTNTTERMRLTPTGLGIGTSTPDAKLKIQAGNSDNPATSFAVRQNNAADTAQTTFSIEASPNDGVSRLISTATSTPQLAFYTGNNEVMRLDSNGRLGIGTSSPNQKLQISGNALSTTFQGETISAGSTERLRLGYRAGGPESGLTCGQIIEDTFTLHIAGRDTANGDIIFHAGSAAPEVMRLDASNGNLGVGTSSPSSTLHMRAGSPELIIDKSTAVNATGGDTEVVKITAKGQKNGVTGPCGSIIFRQDDSTWSSVNQFHKPTRIELCTQDAGTDDKSEVPRLVINRNGLVGIGTSTPSNKLEVAGHANHRIAVLSTDTTMTAGSDYGGFRFATSHAGNPRAINWDIYQVAGNTAGNTNLTIDSHAVDNAVKILAGGNVGLSWEQPSRPLVVNRSTSNSWVSVRSSDTGKAGILMGDQTADSTGQLAYDNNTESLQFISAGSERMRLTSTGLGIGNSSPASRLHIGGGTNANNYITFHNRVPAAQSNKPLIGQTSGADGADGSAQDLGLCATSSSGAIRFFTGNNAAGFGTGANSERMSISHSGVVAITGSLTVNGQTITPGGGRGGGGGASGYVNVKDLGAVGNGTTDDTTAIRTALQSGGAVYFPEGTYRVTSTIAVTNQALHMYGDGQGSRILFDPNTSGDAFLDLSYNDGTPNPSQGYAISNLVIHAKQNKVCDFGVRLYFTGGGSGVTLVGVANKLTLTNVDIGSEFASDANTGYFKRGLVLLNSAGVVGTNVNIYTNAKTKVEYGVTDSIAIHIQNTLSNHFMIRTLMLNNIYLQRYHTAIKSEATASDVNGNIESIYLSQGEILAAKALDINRGSAITVVGCHSDVRDYFFDGTRFANTIRIVGCDIRANRLDSEDTTTRDFLMKFRGQNTLITGNFLASFRNTSGILYSGGSNSNHANMVITGNHFSGNTSSAFRVLRTDVGSTNITFGGNTLEQFGGNNNPIFNSVGSQLYVYGQRP